MLFRQSLVSAPKPLVPLGDCAIHSPWMFGSDESCAENFFGYARGSAKIGQSVGFSFPFKKHIRDAVVSLFSACGPAAVSWFVSGVIVRESIKSFTFWPLAHISKEIFKLSPSFANCNSSASIVIKSRIRFVGASGYHCGPRTIGRRLVSFCRMSMRSLMERAFSRFSGAESFPRNSLFCPAITSTNPCGASAYKSVAPNDQPHPKSQAKHIFRSRGSHNRLKLFVCADYTTAL